MKLPNPDNSGNSGNFKNARSSRQSGVILVFSLLMVLGITALAVGMLTNARMNKSGGLNYKNRLQSFYAADGMMTLIAQEISDGRDSVYTAKSGSSRLHTEIWTSYSGGYGHWSKMTEFAKANSTPNKKDSTYYLGTKLNINNYLVRIKGYLHPPITGDYKIMVRADSLGAFFLSSDDKPENLAGSPLAYGGPAGTTWPMSSRWPASGTSVSDPKFLEAGKRYYFEFFHADNGGNHFGDVGWMGPESVLEQPILGHSISLYGSAETQDDTLTLGQRRVQYRVMRSGLDIFAVYTQGFRAKGKDTGFHVPLNQVLSMKGKAVTPPEQVPIPVIYYDFRSNGSNPEFETSISSVVERKGLVDAKIEKWDTRNADHFGYDQLPKPTPSAMAEATCGVDRWFEPWTAGSAKNHWRPRYSGGNWKDCTPIHLASNDTSYKNIVIKDTLLFDRKPELGPNTYWYADTGWGDAMFFPIDGRGFGVSETITGWMGLQHNYSFCMEMHSKFELFSGMSFEFKGDDDVWLFVNDSLVMDLGYLHAAVAGQVDFDKLPLRYGETYSFDFFYCERRSIFSSLKIVTNIPMARAKGKTTRAWTRNYGNM